MMRLTESSDDLPSIVYAFPIYSMGSPFSQDKLIEVLLLALGRCFEVMIRLDTLTKVTKRRYLW